MKYDWITGVFIYLHATALVAQGFGAHREIGYRKSVYWCIVLTPIIGLIVTLSSPKIKKGMVN
jgi:Na+-driven multidrug efflux pump